MNQLLTNEDKFIIMCYLERLKELEYKEFKDIDSSLMITHIINKLKDSA